MVAEMPLRRELTIHEVAGQNLGLYKNEQPRTSKDSECCTKIPTSVYVTIIKLWAESYMVPSKAMLGIA